MIILTVVNLICAHIFEHEFVEVSQMNFKCTICGKEDYSLLRANHKDLGIIKLCVDCWSKEQNKNKLLSLEGGSNCCR